MGIFYNLNAVSFLDLVPLKTKYNSLDEFRNEADDLYKDLAVRCYVSAIVYGLFVVISLLCLQIKNNQIANAVKKKMYAKEQVWYSYHCQNISERIRTVRYVCVIITENAQKSLFLFFFWIILNWS